MAGGGHGFGLAIVLGRGHGEAAEDVGRGKWVVMSARLQDLKMRLFPFMYVRPASIFVAR
jgi:hypothetical protein